MVEVYDKKARQKTRRTLPTDTWVNVQCKEGRKEVEEKKGRKKTSSPREGTRTHNPHLRRQGSSLYRNISLHKDPWLQLLYKYHEGYILNSIAQYPMHMKEREKVSKS